MLLSLLDFFKACVPQADSGILGPKKSLKLISSDCQHSFDHLFQMANLPQTALIENDYLGFACNSKFKKKKVFFCWKLFVL